MNGREVGGRKDELDPFILRRELVTSITVAAENGAIRPKTAPQRSNSKELKKGRPVSQARTLTW